MRTIPLVTKAVCRRWAIGLLGGACLALMPGSTESAIANGDTRTLSLIHAHTHETITATFLVNGQYDQAVLDKLNWFLRDWRRDEPTHMDPRLFDTVWEVYRESGSQQPIMVMSAYRSPETNAMLRRRSRQVAEHSQHILGKAMDQHYMDVPMSRIRELGMKLQRGGVGFYPTAGTPFVHLDVGGVRHWPRMSYDQLARLFPDGKTVHIPSNGQPLPGYELARAELESRGDGSYPTASQLKSKGFFAWLFGNGGADEDDDDAAAGVKSSRGANTRMASAAPVVDTSVGSYGKNASDRVTGGGGLFGVQPSRTAAFVPPRAPEPRPLPSAPPPITVPPIAPPVQAIPQQAVALAVPPSPSAGSPETGTVTPVANLPVPTSTLAALPLPPRRPSELVAIEAAAPLPPSRPSDLVAVARSTLAPHDLLASLPSAAPRKADLIASLLASSRGRLPAVITQGTPAKPAPQALGYSAMAVLSEEHPADAAVPMPVARPTTMLSAHLDRSNFRQLTRPESTGQTTGRSALGAAVPPLRATMRGDLGALAPVQSVHPETFQLRAPDLSPDRFSGQVIKPTARATSLPKTDVD